MAIVARFTAKSIAAFFGNYRNHYQRGDWIGPLPAEDGVEKQAA